MIIQPLWSCRIRTPAYDMNNAKQAAVRMANGQVSTNSVADIITWDSDCKGKYLMSHDTRLLTSYMSRFFEDYQTGGITKEELTSHLDEFFLMHASTDASPDEMVRVINTIVNSATNGNMHATLSRNYEEGTAIAPEGYWYYNAKYFYDFKEAQEAIAGWANGLLQEKGLSSDYVEGRCKATFNDIFRTQLACSAATGSRLIDFDSEPPENFVIWFGNEETAPQAAVLVDCEFVVKEIPYSERKGEYQINLRDLFKDVPMRESIAKYLSSFNMLSLFYASKDPEWWSENASNKHRLSVYDKLVADYGEFLPFEGLPFETHVSG